MNFKQHITRALFALVLGFALKSGALAEHPVPADVIPEGALGYVHIFPQALRDTSTMALFDRMLSHVETEASLLSMTRLGLDLTELEDITIVIAPIDQVMKSKGSLPCVFVATVGKSFRPNSVGAQLPSSWRNVSEKDQILFENRNGHSLHVFSNTTLVIGPTDSVRWWMNTAGEEGQSSLPILLSNSYESGHILFGIDLRNIPHEMLNGLHPAANSFIDAHFASLDLHLGEHLQAAVYLHFGADNEAQVAGKELRKVIQQGTGLLALSEGQLSAVVKDGQASVDQVMGGLFGLAFAREAAETLENVQVSVDGVDVVAKISLDESFISTVGLCLASIQAIGSHASKEFEDIADQLGQ